MKNYFLDTSFLIDLINEEEEALDKHRDIKGQEVTGTPCIYELSKFTQFDLSELFGQKKILEMNSSDAETAGNIYYNLSSEGIKIGEMDLIIAGMVKNRNAVLVTRDKDFKKVEGLELEMY